MSPAAPSRLPPSWKKWTQAEKRPPPCCSGYVALAVVGGQGTLTKELDTGLGGDRSANMVAFAVEALRLVEEYITKNGAPSGDL